MMRLSTLSTTSIQTVNSSETNPSSCLNDEKDFLLQVSSKSSNSFIPRLVCLFAIRTQYAQILGFIYKRDHSQYDRRRDHAAQEEGSSCRRQVVARHETSASFITSAHVDLVGQSSRHHHYGTLPFNTRRKGEGTSATQSTQPLSHRFQHCLPF